MPAKSFNDTLPPSEEGKLNRGALFPSFIMPSRTTSLASLSMRSADNASRTPRGEHEPHVESHFVKATSADATRALWIKHTLLVRPRGPSVAEVWAVAFDAERGPVAAAKRTHPLGDARFELEPFRYAIGTSVLSDTSAAGAVASGAHSLSWSLEWAPNGAPFHPYPLERMYTGPFPRTKTLTPHPDVRIGGRLDVDGETWELDGWPGMQGHNWGPRHSERYAWAHANCWDGGHDDVWLEIAAVRIRVGGLLLPWLGTGAIHVGGQAHRFDGPRAILSPTVDVGTRHYRTSLRARGARIFLDARAETNALAGLHYESPDGTMTHCLNSKLAHATVRLERAGHPPLELVTHALALEIGTPDPRHGVEMLV